MKKSDHSSPKPPAGLSPEAQRWWRELQGEYQIADAGGLAVLAAGAAAFDRGRQARALVEAEGMTTVDRFGQARAHPMLAVERDARDQMLRALKSLNLDLEPLKSGAGRSAGSK